MELRRWAALGAQNERNKLHASLHHSSAIAVAIAISVIGAIAAVAGLGRRPAPRDIVSRSSSLPSAAQLAG